MEAGKDKFQLTWIGYDIADRENTFNVGLERLRINVDKILFQIQTPVRNRAKFHLKAIESQKRIAGNDGFAIWVFDRDGFQIRCSAM